MMVNSLVTPPLCVLKGKHFLFSGMSNLFPLSLPLFPFTLHLNSPLGKQSERKIKIKGHIRNADVILFYSIFIVVQ